MSRLHHAVRAAAVILTVALTVALVGCADPQEYPGLNPYASDFRAAIDRVPDGLQKEILENGLRTGTITRAEFDEARTAVVNCMRDRGYDAELDGEGYGYPVDETLCNGTDCAAAYDAAQLDADACEKLYWSEVSPLYYATTLNPLNEDWDQLTRQCLITAGLIPADMTVEEMIDLLLQDDTPLPLSNPEVSRCSSDPKGIVTPPPGNPGG